MKYDASTPIGLDWAALISVKDAYDWEPGSYMDGLEESDILGIEAPLWTETVVHDERYRIYGVPAPSWDRRISMVTERTKLGGISTTTRGTWQADGGDGDQFL